MYIADWVSYENQPDAMPDRFGTDVTLYNSWWKECARIGYSELIKNFEKVRAYMREFYVYGFKSRTEYDAKSARSYDDERRRLESWLGDYMHFTQTP